MHSALEHVDQQLSVSSLFFAHGAQLSLADSLAIPTHSHSAQPQGTHSHYRDGGGVHISEFVLPNSPEQSVPCAFWCISP